MKSGVVIWTATSLTVYFDTSSSTAEYPDTPYGRARNSHVSRPPRAPGMRMPNAISLSNFSFSPFS